MMDLMKTAAEVQLVKDTKAVLACNEESGHFVQRGCAGSDGSPK